MRLPTKIRNAILGAYVPGQEVKKNPTIEYVEAAMAAQSWIRGTFGVPVKRRDGTLDVGADASLRVNTDEPRYRQYQFPVRTLGEDAEGYLAASLRGGESVH